MIRRADPANADFVSSKTQDAYFTTESPKGPSSSPSGSVCSQRTSCECMFQRCSSMQFIPTSLRLEAVKGYRLTPMMAIG